MPKHPLRTPTPAEIDAMIALAFRVERQPWERIRAVTRQLQTTMRNDVAPILRAMPDIDVTVYDLEGAE